MFSLNSFLDLSRTHSPSLRTLAQTVDWLVAR